MHEGVYGRHTSMTNIEESEDDEWSLQVYQLLSNVFGSEKTVRLRQLLFTIEDKFIDTLIPSYISILSGSKGEGLDFSDSDIDVMKCYRKSDVSVFESVEKARSCKYTTNRLVLEYDDTKLPFTKLRQLGEMTKDCADYYPIEENSFISSEEIKEYTLASTQYIAKIHGPCLTTKDDNIDTALTLRCSSWIRLAQSWISRSRSFWPSNDVLKAIVGFGVLLVPISCRGSPSEDIEWRISFSVSEKLLIQSFTHTQMLCYAAMKCILKDIIQPKHPEILCSYFIKSIMLWLAEENNVSFWTPRNMISCLESCLKRLLYCVEYKICLHYFLPEVNFFESRFTDQIHADLIATLTEVQNLGWESILHSKRITCVNTTPSLCSSPKLWSNVVYMNVDTNLFFYILDIFGGSEDIKRICFNYFSTLFVNNITTNAFVGRDKKNKDIYKEHKANTPYLLLATNSNATRAWSTLASLFYSLGDYQKSKTVIRHCRDVTEVIKLYANDIKSYCIMQPNWGYISHITEPYSTYTLPFIAISWLIPEEIRPRLKPLQYEEILRLHKYRKTLSRMTKGVAVPFPFNPSIKDKDIFSYVLDLNPNLVLNALKDVHLLETLATMLSPPTETDETWVMFHTLPFLDFIDFLCSFHLNDVFEARRALHNLETECFLLYRKKIIETLLSEDFGCLEVANSLFNFIVKIK